MTCLITSVSTFLSCATAESDHLDQETLDDFLDFVFEVLAAAVSGQNCPLLDS